MGDAVSFDLSTVFQAVADAIPDSELLVWRDRRFTYAQTTARVDGVANYLASVGLGCHTERGELAGHDSGQDHLGLYLRNGNEYLESMIAAYRARVAPFNVSYRYVEEELVYLLTDSKATALVYNAEFAPRVEAIRDRLPDLRVLSRSPTKPATRCCPVRWTTSRSSPPRLRSMACRRRAATISTSFTPAVPPGCPRACCGDSTTSSSPRWAVARSAATRR